ncbi:MAG: glycosyltransferase family 1 protein, partial [Planctomycetaceae bacterium]|nr:glycosyltransferase family 1 protein [Planctomycetaceae bacterium]
MHVLHVIEATIGGTRRHVVDATRGLAKRGVRVSLVASALREPRFRADLQALANDGVEVFELPMVRAL